MRRLYVRNSRPNPPRVVYTSTAVAEPANEKQISTPRTNISLPVLLSFQLWIHFAALISRVIDDPSMRIFDARILYSRNIASTFNFESLFALAFSSAAIWEIVDCALG